MSSVSTSYAGEITEEQSDSLEQENTLSQVCHVFGYLSIIASVATWMFAQGNGSIESIAHAERFGVFVGLWAPTFFILSMKYDRSRR